MNEFKKNPSQLIVENKEYIYPVMFYAAGLLIGTFCYKTISNSAISTVIEMIFSNKQKGFLAIFINIFSINITVYAVCVFLGMCLVGFPFINVIMTVLGAEIAIKTAYYYVNFSLKGIGFALLMIIPQGAAIGTVLIYAIKTSNELSKQIFDITARNNNSNTVELKKYAKSYLLLGLFVLLISLLNALISYLLSAIINI